MDLTEEQLEKLERAAMAAWERLRVELVELKGVDEAQTRKLFVGFWLEHGELVLQMIRGWWRVIQPILEATILVIGEALEEIGVEDESEDVVLGTIFEEGNQGYFDSEPEADDALSSELRAAYGGGDE